jgi:exonuclease SbcD
MDNDTVQVLCTGDLHLGRHPTRIPERLDGSTFSPRSVWQAVVQEAIEQKVDAVVLTGDIADRENRYFEAYGAFEAGIIDLDNAGIPTITVAGNHDAEFLPRMVDDIDLERLHLVGRDATWERWTLEKDGTEVVHFDGWSFPQPHVSTSPLEEYDLPETDDTPQIGVLHTDLDSPRSDYAPVSSSELKDTDMAGWLLGHIHVPGIRIESDPMTIYPGSPQALDPGERGVHGPWVISITPDGVIDTEKIPLGTVCYDEIDVDVSGSEDLQAVVPKISTAIDEYVQDYLRSGNTSAFLPRIRLKGRTPAHAELIDERQSLEEQLATKRGRIDIEIEAVSVDTRPDIDLEARAEGDGPVSYLAELLLALEEGQLEDQHHQLVDGAHDAMQRAYQGQAYNPLRREAGAESPEREAAVDTLQQEARRLLDTLLQQKEGHT